ncbi:hypothetical protein [Prosthecobacter sp.]|uniref:hypothetical protein n=1 Tax=Prosthecobacter sp. TaxID=1965333 RepID=UPI003783C98C
MKLLLPSLILAATALAGSIAQAQTAPLPPGVTRVPVTFSGGHDTDPRDHGRPVILIGSALGVTAEIFRDAFSGVHPVGPGRGGPSREEAQANKKVLMDKLGKYGITNDRLDEVSNFYRYPPGSRDLWKHTPAVANALVKNGAVTGFEIVSGGAGYTTPPTVTVPGISGVNAKAEIAFGKKFETNGSVSSIKLEPAK